MGNPRYAVLIFDYGRAQPALLQNMPQLDTEAACIAWYNATFPGAPTPQRRGVIEANIAALNMVDPIQTLINRIKLHALAILHGTGRWNHHNNCRVWYYRPLFQRRQLQRPEQRERVEARTLISY
jgi:hypothetical protein